MDLLWTLGLRAPQLFGRPMQFDRTAAGTLEDLALSSLSSKGWRNLGPRIAKSLKVEDHGKSLSVVSNEPAAFSRQFGAFIRPLRASALTIPVSNISKGKSVAELRAQGWKIFRAGDALLGTNGGGPAVVLFALSKGVRHPADPWLPSGRRIAEALGPLLVKGAMR